MNTREPPWPCPAPAASTHGRHQPPGMRGLCAGHPSEHCALGWLEWVTRYRHPQAQARCGLCPPLGELLSTAPEGRGGSGAAVGLWLPLAPPCQHAGWVPSPQDVSSPLSSLQRKRIRLGSAGRQPTSAAGDRGAVSLQRSLGETFQLQQGRRAQGWGRCPCAGGWRGGRHSPGPLETSWSQAAFLGSARRVSTHLPAPLYWLRVSGWTPLSEPWAASNPGTGSQRTEWGGSSGTH